jgi:hypothetical protein
MDLHSYNSLWHALSLLSQLFLHYSSGNDFQWQIFPFLRVSELSPCLSPNISQITNSQQLHTQEDSLQTKSSCVTSKSKSKLCYNWQSVGQSVLLSGTNLRPTTRFLLLSQLRACWCGVPSLTWGWVCHNSDWHLPVPSFSGQSPMGLTTVFYCLRFETPTTSRARFPYLYPPGTGWPPGTVFPFRHLLQLAGL